MEHLGVEWCIGNDSKCKLLIELFYICSQSFFLVQTQQSAKKYQILGHDSHTKPIQGCLNGEMWCIYMPQGCVKFKKNGELSF